MCPVRRESAGLPVLARRAVLLGAACLLSGLRGGAAAEEIPAEVAIALVERRLGGRLGVAVLDSGTGRALQHRASERFPLCSTFKLLLAAAVLRRINRAQDTLHRRIAYGAQDLVAFSPVTSAHLAEGGMTLVDLCEAAVRDSDNAAANLLLRHIGGPPALTGFARSLKDPVTRIDRQEPVMNEGVAGDDRDTTLPVVMLGNMRLILLRGVLSATARQRLEGWMQDSTTGANRIRAGVPAGWTVGDKTGSGGNGATCDLAILRPPGRQPILVAAYLADCAASAAERDAALAEVGRITAGWAVPG